MYCSTVHGIYIWVDNFMRRNGFDWNRQRATAWEGRCMESNWRFWIKMEWIYLQAGRRLLIWSCLPGLYGKSLFFADTEGGIRSLPQIVCQGFFCFFCGNPSARLVRNKPDDRESTEFVILVPPSADWEDMIEGGCLPRMFPRR